MNLVERHIGFASSVCLHRAGNYRRPTGPVELYSASDAETLTLKPVRGGRYKSMKVYLDYTQEELDRQYEHRHFVPDADDFVAAQRIESERVRNAARAVHPDYDDPAFLNWLRNYTRKHQIAVIVPSENFLQGIRSAFDEFASLVPVSADPSVVYRGLNKCETFEALQSASSIVSAVMVRSSRPRRP